MDKRQFHEPLIAEPVSVANCRMNRDELTTLLSNSGYGTNALMFSSFFRPGVNGGPPLCNACGLPIASHDQQHIATAALPAPQFAGHVASVQQYSEPAGLMQPNPNAIPINMKREGMVDTYNRRSSILFIILSVAMLMAGIIQVTVFYHSGLLELTPAMVFIPVLIFSVSLAAAFNISRTEVTFDRAQREFTVSTVRTIFPCFRTSASGNFSQLEGVYREMSSISVNKVLRFHASTEAFAD